MGLLKQSYKILGITTVFLAVAAPSAMAEPLNASYSLTFAGLPFGHCNISSTETGSTYTITSNLKLTGVIRLFTSHTSRTTVTGEKADYTLGPRHYDTHYKTKNKPRHVLLKYDANGALSEEVVEPAEDPSKRPPPTAAQKAKSLDALSLIPALRAWLQNAQTGESNRFKVFDGRRLMYADFRVIGPASITWKGKKTEVIRVGVSREAIAGYTQKELKEMNAGDPPVDIFLTPAPRLMPLKLSTSSGFGKIEAVLK